MLRKDIGVAGQNCWHLAQGAGTGEVSAEQLVDAGCTWVILGHSERRSHHQESNAYISAKVLHARQAGLSVLACVGETLAEREEGRTQEVVEEQMRSIAAGLTPGCYGAGMVVAYEPVWAIGTGKVATPEQAQEVHQKLRQWLHTHVSPAAAAETRIVYGGSVTGANAPVLAKQPDIDGFMVGGASLKPEFTEIVCSARTHVAAAAEAAAAGAGAA